MANLTVSWKTQTLNLLGPTPSNAWLGFKWGTGTWGVKSAGTGGSPPLIESIFKVWSKTNSLSITHNAASLSRGIYRTWSGSNKIICLYSNKDKERFTGNGYNYIYIDNVKNIESAAAAPNYSAMAQGSSGWVTLAAAGTPWS